MLGRGRCIDLRQQTATTTTVIIVRHAERNPGEDPPLTPEGEVRAQALASALSIAGVTAIFTTQFLCNQQTAAPLAAATAAPVTKPATHSLRYVHRFTLEHIRAIGGQWGFKHEEIYRFDAADRAVPVQGINLTRCPCGSERCTRENFCSG